jgi:glycosyltransferase involved in cell wall biosynthesis
MNILFITEDHSIKNYGVTTVVAQLVNEIANRDNGIRIIIAAIGRDSVQQLGAVAMELIHPARIGAFWRWSPGLMGRLNNIVTRHHIDLIHIHGVWTAIQFAALMIARHRKISCIVSSHAMLEPWYWNKQSLFNKYKKVMYFNFFLRRVIAENVMFHAITPIEKDNLRKLLPRQKIFVIPNAISLDKQNAYDNVAKLAPPEKIFLFLGRLHPVKGVDLLVNAFYRANLGHEWKLILAGPESVPHYVEKIKATVLKLGLSNSVEFTGPIFGVEKQELIQKTWTVVFPSYCEVVGMVNLEAAACRVPSITTFETGLLDWEEGGGMLIHPNVDELTDSLLNASRWRLSERLCRGNKSFELVANKYSWKTVTPKWETLYSSVITDNTL